MFYCANAAFVPNIINQTSEEEEVFNKTRLKHPFKQIGNLKAKGLIENSPKQRKRQFSTIASNQEQSNFASNVTLKARHNVIIEFQSDEQSLTIGNPQTSLQNKRNQKQQIQNNKSFGNFLPRNRNLFQLNFSDDEEYEAKQEQQQEIPQKTIQKNINFSNSGSSDQHIEEIQPYFDEIQSINGEKQIGKGRANLVLDFQTSSDEQTQRQELKKKRTLLSNLISKADGRYYLQPIERGSVFECIIKRETIEGGFKYLVYDSTTLLNFITIIKDQEGYLVISKDQNDWGSNSVNFKDGRVIAKIISNFFGTEFNCYLCDYNYRGRKVYHVDVDKNQQSITVEYETNLFGIRGPRKISAFIPHIASKMVGSRHLNEIYQRELKKKRIGTILKFKNKTATWRKQMSAYMLNFFGRATISSVKNFIMIGEKESEQDQGCILFGKFGKDLFNLDIRYPFNLIQGITLALSSFDRKLACD